MDGRAAALPSQATTPENAMTIRRAALAATATLCLALPALADDCTEALHDNDAWLRDAPEVRASLDTTAQRDLRDLRAAALILQRNGKDDACEDVVDAMHAIAEERHDAVEAQAEAQDDNARMERLAASVSVAELQGVLRADELIGRDVRNMQDEDLGEVDDVVVATSDAGHSYAIVAYGGFLGIGEEQVAVPLSSLRLTQDRDVLVLDISEDAFDRAPRFERDDMSSLNDPAWAERNRAFFNGNG